MRPMLAALALVALSAVPGASRAEPTASAPTPLPHPPPSIVAGCSASERTEVMEAITMAISVGAPIFNAGDHASCFRMYDEMAREIEAHVGGRCSGITRALRDGRARAAAATNDTDRAWLMRYAFDAILWALETY